MQMSRIGVLGTIFAIGLAAGIVSTSVVGGAQRAAPADAACGTSASPQVRTTLYFGLARPKGSVSELDTADARAALQTVIARYRKSFDQESVLWETARVCTAQ